MRGRAVPFAAALAVMAVFYLVPNLIEARLLGVVPPIAILLVGDLAGCLAIARISWKLGAALYGGLTVTEAALLQTQVLSIDRLIWVTDLVPALMLAAFAAAMVTISDLR